MRQVLNNGDLRVDFRTNLNTMTADLYYGLIAADAQLGGAVADGVTDNFTIIQALIDTYGIVKIGNTRNDIFLISQPLVIPSNKTIIINGTIKIMDGLSTTLASNVGIGDTTLDVTDASIFTVGQWIGVTDDNTLQVYATYRAWTGEITDITGNTITLDNPSFSVLTTVANGYTAHLQNIIIISEVTHVTILGTGLLDGNKSGQFQLHPVREIAVTEQQRAGCCITVYICDDIRIEGVEMQDALLHNLAITAFEDANRSNRIRVSNVNCVRAHDKNIVVKWGVYVYFDNIYCADAVWEDGLRFYSSCKYGFVFNATLINNARNGFGYSSSSNIYGQFANIFTADNGDYGVDVGSPYLVLSNINSTDRMRLTDIQADCHDINISNVNLIGVPAAQALLIQGDVRRARITGLSIIDAVGIGLQTTDYLGDQPSDIKIIAGTIVNSGGAALDIVAGTDIDYVEFDT